MTVIGGSPAAQVPVREIEKVTAHEEAASIEGRAGMEKVAKALGMILDRVEPRL